MGYSKVIKIAPGKVRVVHQLDYQTGKPYAEDFTVESEAPGRLDWLEKQDGQIGTVNFMFTAISDQESAASVKFPDE